MPKIPRPAQSSDRHNPLAEEYSATHSFKTKAPKKRSRKDEDEDGDAVVGTKASRKILKIGRELEEEDEEERKLRLAAAQGKGVNKAFSFETRFPQDGESEEETSKWDEEEVAWGEEEEKFEVEEIDVNDLEAFHKFIPPSFDDPILRSGEEAQEQQPINLGDKILAAIAEHEAAQGGAEEADEGFGEGDEDIQLPPMAVEVYTQVGLILSRYKSGKLPKPFKLLPSLPPSMLTLIIPLTNPSEWTPNSILAATRLFVSSNSVVSEGFLTSILLERIREDIAESKKLNIHLFNAIKKSLYKPKEFFRGFLFPLVSSGSCTLREASIVSSALSRVSIPVLHSAYGLARLCEIAAEQMSINTEAGGATNVFIKTLLEKRYALPYQTIDALVFHFLRFRPTQPQPLPSQAEAMEIDAREIGNNANGLSSRPLNKQRWLPDRSQGILGKLPVIWHQCLLAFAQRYRDEITEDQREALLDLLLIKGHKDIGPEVRRELLAGRGRGVVKENEMDLELQGPEGGDDTMMG